MATAETNTIFLQLFHLQFYLLKQNPVETAQFVTLIRDAKLKARNSRIQCFEIYGTMADIKLYYHSNAHSH